MAMTVTGVANLAVKVADLDSAIAFYERAGASVRDRQHWRNGERVDVRLGVLDLTLFTKAIYEDSVELPREGFLHVATFTDDLDAEIIGHDVIWGPEVVSGAFGTRRIVFVEAPGGMRLEFMEQLEPPPADVDRAAPDIGDTAEDVLGRLGSATLAEAGARVLDRRIVGAWPGAALAGRCATVHCAPGDNLAVHAAVASAPAGSVLAVAVDQQREHGFWGEVLTVAAQTRGVAGLVIDACVRDTRSVRARGFPIFATGTALPGATKEGPGSVGCAVTFGDQPIETGDWIIGDDDGLVVIADGDLHAVLARGLEREAAERVLFAQLQAGATTVQLLGLDVDPIEGVPSGAVR